MNNGRITAEMLASSVPFKRSISRIRHHIYGGWWPSALTSRQWLVLLVMGFIVIIIEIHNHSSMWQAHQSGQTFFTDRELVFEVVLYGCVFPLLTGVLLNYLGRTAGERDKVRGELALRRRVVSEINGAPSWAVLAPLVASVPAKVVPAERSWLLLQRPDEDGVAEVAGWQHTDYPPVPLCRAAEPEACLGCPQLEERRPARITACTRFSAGNSPSCCDRYCLPLTSEAAGKAVLVFEMAGDRPLAPDERAVLDDLGDEITLAVANANLAYVTQKQADVAKNERLRIARDLHDTLGQNVSYLRLKLEQLSLSGVAGDHGELHDELRKMLGVAEEAYAQVRDTLEELRMVAYEDLEESVRQYAAQAAARTGFAVQVRSSGRAGTLSARRNRQLMYIVREALNNVEKHAVAENVEIHLAWCEAQFTLTVRDNGWGFEPEAVNLENRYGMAIMGERARAIDATLAIDSRRGEGTTLTVNVPLAGAGGTIPAA